MKDSQLVFLSQTRWTPTPSLKRASMHLTTRYLFPAQFACRVGHTTCGCVPHDLSWRTTQPNAAHSMATMALHMGVLSLSKAVAVSCAQLPVLVVSRASCELRPAVDSALLAKSFSLVFLPFSMVRYILRHRMESANVQNHEGSRRCAHRLVRTC